MAEIDDYHKPLQIDMPLNEALQRFVNVTTEGVVAESEEEYSSKTALPFVKWAGGKRSIINELVSRLPSSFNNYFEPFVGSGALFFEIQKKLKNAYLSDVVFDLIIAYLAIKKNPDELIKLLKRHSKNHNNEYYYKIRGQHELEGPIQTAARFIYLNKTCYNGLFRVNKSGHFNVPVGSNLNPNITQESNIRACNKVLKNVTVKYYDYRNIPAQDGDFVYFDPPYHPTTETSFTKYTKYDFSEKDQSDLRNFVVSLHKKGVKMMLSNSKTEYIKTLYKSSIFKIHTIKAPRYVNCKPNGRNLVEEFIIINY